MFDILFYKECEDLPYHNNIQVIKDNKIILEAGNYSQLIEKIIVYSQKYGNAIITYNQEKKNYYILDRHLFQKGAWTSSFSALNDEDDYLPLLYEIFNKVEYRVINKILMIYVE